MDSKKKSARIAGLLYLLLAITGAFGIMYIPSSIQVTGDATATANNIVTSEFTFRLSMISNLISSVLYVFLALALGRLFKEVDAKHVKLMLSLVIIAVPIGIVNVINLIAAQSLAGGSDFLGTFEQEQRNDLALFFLNLYNSGLSLAGIFWGLWLYPFGMLVIKSKFIPKIIGILLIIGCFAYVLDSFLTLLLPEYRKMLADYLMIPLAIGEFSIVFWLLIKGVKNTH
jgi:hypothetical protein